MAMYEYVIAASKEDEYSPHLEATTLAIGQALHSYFLRSKKYTMKDNFCTYSIDSESSDIENHKFSVQIQKNNDNSPPKVLQVDLPAIYNLSFWLYSYSIPDDVEDYNIYECLHNLLSSTITTGGLLGVPTIILLKYEPMDAFLLHQIIVDCAEYVF